MKTKLLQGKYNVKAKITIKASKHEVWEILKDFNNVYTWAPGVKESYGLNNKYQEVGAGRHCKLEGFGEIDEYIQQWDEGSGFVYDVTPLGPLTNVYSSWYLSSVNKSMTTLKVTLSYDIRFGLFGKIMHKLIMRKKLNEALPQTLESVKKRVETGEMIRPLLEQPA
ncbi:MAG: SRPBCC family protein [Alcanivoracaceae bacterium]|nr:SRPBCC family protein [Alcanivoracaceae bacterium]